MEVGSGHQPIDFPETAPEQAAYWLALFLDGQETAKDQQAFAAWFSENPENAQAFHRMERIWNGSGGLNLGMNKKLDRRAFIGGSAAALVLVTGFAAYRYKPDGDFRTAYSERLNLDLPGNVRAKLASNSAIALLSQDGVLGVELLKGEAWFDQSLSSGRPFFVKARRAKIFSTSGCFDIACHDDEVTVISEKGELDVRVGSGSTRLDSGHAVQVIGDRVSPPHQVDIDTALAWRHGRLVFMGEPLGQVAATLERWQAGSVVIWDEALKQQPVTLVVELDRLHTVLPNLERVLSIKVRQFSDYLTIITRA